MSSVHRILTGLEFVLDPIAGRISWPAETEDMVRLSIELARMTRSGLAFAAIARPPVGEFGCDQLDDWSAEAEQQIEQITRTASAEEFPIEQAAWFGHPEAEWALSAQESEIDLLIVSGAPAPESPGEGRVELQWPEQAKCPVWFAGRELDRLDAAPALIVFCDDLSNEAAEHLPFAVDLALAWNTRLLIVHPLSQPVETLTTDDADRLRREVFVRLSRTDFRALSHGSQLRLLPGGLPEILAQVSTEQVPNLIMTSARLAHETRPSWRGHLLLWPNVGERN